LAQHEVVVVITTVKSAEVIKKLEADGWQLQRIKGSHHQFKRPGHLGLVTVPQPRAEIALGTLRSIYKQADWPWR
jgi:predicted RNA binding protein YcfA (HicA-like mRNA interferase family)